MPRKSKATTATAAPRTPTGPFIVQNPRGIPKGRVIIKFHACAEDRDPDDHTGCSEVRWYEGDVCDPPEGMDTTRFLEHQPMPGQSCGDDTHTDCAGPYLAEGAAKEVSNDGQAS